MSVILAATILALLYGLAWQQPVKERNSAARSNR
jgi:hypothetical protein